MRSGHGEWAAIREPAAGVLWRRTDRTDIGFESVPGADPQPVLDVLAADGIAAWDALTVGVRTTVGDLVSWKADRGQYPRVMQL